MYEFLHYQVRDVMTPNPLTIRPDVTFADAQAIFEEHDFNGLPVVDGTDRLVGFFTKLDLLKAFVFTEDTKLPHYEAIMCQNVSQVMVKKVDIFYPETRLTRVLEKMIETRNKSYPVVFDNRVLGVVAREDVLRALHQAGRREPPARLTSSDLG